MQFIRTIHEHEAAGHLKDIYDAEVKATGHVPNYVKAFSLRPEVYEAWRNLSKAVRGNMRLRRYELATIAAAGACRCNT